MALIERRVGTQGNVTYRARIRIKGHPPEIATFQGETVTSTAPKPGAALSQN